MSEQQGFFQRRPLRRALYNWLERHQHPFNRGIHFLGIPLAVAGVILFFTLPWEEWYPYDRCNRQTFPDLSCRISR
jgi:hypothetical protein